MKSVSRKPQGVKRHPLDGRMNDYPKRIAMARELGFESVTEAIHELWEQEAFTIRELGEMFGISPPSTNVIKNRLPCRRIAKRGGRQSSGNVSGTFLHNQSGHRFVAGETQRENGICTNYRIIRCTECHEILSSHWIGRDEVFLLIDHHRKKCWRKKHDIRTNDNRKNHTGIFLSRKNPLAKYVSGYCRGSGTDQEYKLIRCCTCNEVISKNRWMGIDEVREKINSHYHKEYVRKFKW